MPSRWGCLSRQERKMTKFHTACLIRQHSPKMADPPLLSVLLEGREAKSTSGGLTIRACPDTEPWAAGTNYDRVWSEIAKFAMEIVSDGQRLSRATLVWIPSAPFRSYSTIPTALKTS